jgi:hypothetical protein
MANEFESGLTVERDSLWVELAHLRGLIDRALPVNHVLRAAFRRVLAVGDNQQPELADLRRIKAAFYALPEAEQRRILNGWSAWPDRADKDQVAASMALNEDAYRVLLLEAGGSQSDGEPRAADVGMRVSVGQTTRLCAGTLPVEVAIKEGVSRKEAVAALHSILNVIERQWDGLIAEPFPGLMAQENSGASIALEAHELAGSESVGAGRVTAA